MLSLWAIRELCPLLSLVWMIVGEFALSSCSAPLSVSNTASPVISTPSSPTTVQSPSTSKMSTSPNTANTIPEPARCYIDAVNANNVDALVGCFAPNGVIVDVDRRITGADAIRAWANNEVMGGKLRVLQSTATSTGVKLLVHWAPKGSAGWQANYTFDDQNGQITQADLQYAN